MTIVPKPQSMKMTDEVVFEFDENIHTRVFEPFFDALDLFNSLLKKQWDFTLSGEGFKTLSIDLDATLPKEGYKLFVNPDEITIFASDKNGAIYALITLFQMLVTDGFSLCDTEIFDFPRLSVRGFMLDTSRYFFPVCDVKCFIDAMVLFKLNTLHLHLTDDQGWRLEIFDRLLLAEVGGFRKGTHFDKKPHGGFYSKNDIKEILEYAKKRGIEVIPEVDGPGHMVSAISAYPELSCFKRKMEVSVHSGVKHDILCMGRESTFDFIFSVLDEVCEMFPSKYVHIGGDEVPTMRWECCPDCQKRMKDEGLKDAKELLNYYLKRVSEYLIKKGKVPMIWFDGENGKGLSKKVIFEDWTNCIKGEDEKKDATIFDANSEAFYLDLPYNMVPLKSSYETKIKGEFGAEALLWTEYVPDMKKAGYCTFPRLCAFCENVWGTNDDYNRFLGELLDIEQLCLTIPFCYATKKQAIPSFIRKKGYQLWFNRREIDWMGLPAIIDDKRIEKMAKKNKQN